MKSSPSPWQEADSSHFNRKYTSESKLVQTIVGINCSHRQQLEAVSLSQAFPRLLLAISEQNKLWIREKPRLTQIKAAETALEQLKSIVKATIWKLAIALDHYFLDHCNGMDQTQPWELVRSLKDGDFIHFILHKEGKTVYSLDFLQWRSDDCPYGVRICSLEKHAK